MQPKSFEQPLAVIIDETRYILQQDFTYEWKMSVQKIEHENADVVLLPKPEDVLNRITVPKGFRWDGASIPKIFWRINFKPDGKHRAAALVHDLIYIYKGKLPGELFQAKYQSTDWHPQSGSFSRSDADRMFGKLMKEAGVNKFYRGTMFWFVRFFGWMFWTDGTDEIIIRSLRFLWSILVITLLVYLVFYPWIKV